MWATQPNEYLQARVPGLYGCARIFGQIDQGGRRLADANGPSSRETAEDGPLLVDVVLNGLGYGEVEVVVVGALQLQLVLDAGPDAVAGVGGFEEAAGLVGDGFEITDQGGAVGVVLEEGLEAGVGADVAVAVGEEVGQIFFKVRRGHGVEVGKPWVGHTATSLKLAGWADCSGWRRSSRSL